MRCNRKNENVKNTKQQTNKKPPNENNKTCKPVQLRAACIFQNACTTAVPGQGPHVSELGSFNFRDECL